LSGCAGKVFFFATGAGRSAVFADDQIYLIHHTEDINCNAGNIWVKDVRKNRTGYASSTSIGGGNCRLAKLANV